MTTTTRTNTPQEDFKKSFNVVSHLQDKPVDKLQKIYKNISAGSFAIAVLNLNGGLNTACMIRTACIYGCEKVFIFGVKKFDQNGMVGAQHYIKIVHIVDSLKEDGKEVVVDEKKFAEVMKENKLVPVFIEQGGKMLNKINWKDKVHHLDKDQTLCFVFGNESRGISKNILDVGKDFGQSIIVSIPQHTIMRSLNVSVSCGIVLYDYYERLTAKKVDCLGLD